MLGVLTCSRLASLFAFVFLVVVLVVVLIVLVRGSSVIFLVAVVQFRGAPVNSICFSVALSCVTCCFMAEVLTFSCCFVVDSDLLCVMVRNMCRLL